MAASKPRRGIARLVAIAIASTGLAALALPSTPAQARVVVSVGVPGPWGYYPGPSYYPYPVYYGYPAYYYYRYAYPVGVYYGHPYWHGHWGYWRGRWHYHR
ncbi:MAG TPA: hypothetical protein VMF05_00680 [Stellaceae bacterium]|nr:hypothetical protein [Stellaceae bacterium]